MRPRERPGSVVSPQPIHYRSISVLTFFDERMKMVDEHMPPSVSWRVFVSKCQIREGFKAFSGCKFTAFCPQCGSGGHHRIRKALWQESAGASQLWIYLPLNDVEWLYKWNAYVIEVLYAHYKDFLFPGGMSEYPPNSKRSFSRPTCGANSGDPSQVGFLPAMFGGTSVS